MMEFSRRMEEEQQVSRDRSAAQISQQSHGQIDMQSTLNKKLSELYQSDLAVQRHSGLMKKTSQDMVKMPSLIKLHTMQALVRTLIREFQAILTAC